MTGNCSRVRGVQNQRDETWSWGNPGIQA